MVYYGGVVDKERMHRIARELGFRDTFFLMPANDPSLLFSSLTFTPHQELAVCGQGMVSGLFALLDDGAIGPGRYAVEIALGERTVWIEEEEGGPVAYAAIGLPTVAQLSSEPPNWPASWGGRWPRAGSASWMWAAAGSWWKPPRPHWKMPGSGRRTCSSSAPTSM